MRPLQIHIVILVSLVLMSNYIESKAEDYGQYHKELTNARSLLFKGESKNALNLYVKTLSGFPYAFPRDIVDGIKISCLVNDVGTIKNLIQLGIQHALDTNFLWHIKELIPFIERYEIKKYTRENIKTWLQVVDLQFNKKTYTRFMSYYLTESKARQQYIANGRKEEYYASYEAIVRNNAQKILRIFQDSNRFIGERTTSINNPYLQGNLPPVFGEENYYSPNSLSASTVILMHQDCLLLDFLPYMTKGLLCGELDPIDFALIYEREIKDVAAGRCNTTLGCRYMAVWTGYNEGKYDSHFIDSCRQNIFLPKLSHLDSLWQFQIRTGIMLCRDL